MVIWKFPLQLKTGTQTIQVPPGTWFLTAAEQDDGLYIWGEFDENLISGHGLVNERVRLQFTGEPYDVMQLDTFKFLSTVFSKTGLVYHIFTEV